jgi:cytochrome c-type biogenesis protein CcmH
MALVAIAIIIVVLPLGAFATYRALGSSQLLGESSVAVASATSPEALEKQLQRKPTAEGYKRLANMYFAAGQYDKAVSADHRAIDLGANDASTWSEFGESIVMASKVGVPPQALAAFTNAISRDPGDARARFYIGLAEAQIGNLRQAVAIWRDLEKDAKPDSKWLPMLREHIAGFSKQGGFKPDSIAPAPPSVAAMRAAVAAMMGAVEQKRAAAAPGEGPQDAVIDGMAEGQARTAQGQPNDAAGWRRLAEVYNVLGETDKAQEALAHAIADERGRSGP